MTREEAIQRLYRMGRSHVGIIDENTLADNKALSMAIEALADRQEVESATIHNEGITFSYRKTGEWINREKCQVDEDAYEVATCSECGAEITIEYPHDSYCPNCGTKMNKMRADDGYDQ